jgi:hypothetical protein
MATTNQFVTGRSDERRVAMLRRENEALRNDLVETTRSAEADKDLHEKEREQLRAIIRDMKGGVERENVKILDLQHCFGKANTRISILTAALMESLQTQFKNIEREKEEAAERIAGKLSNLSDQIIMLKNIVAGDENEYARARLQELEEKL